MNAKSYFQSLALGTASICALAIGAFNVIGAGADYPKGGPFGGNTDFYIVTGAEWPEGMEKLVNSTNRVHGYSWDASDIAFFSGSASNLTSFLRDYARIEGIEAHRLILHEGVGEAKSLSVTNSRPCDWKLFGCPKRWLDWAALTSTQRTNSNEALQRQAAEIMKHSGYDLEIHFWTGGHIALDEVSVPKNVTVTKAQ